LNKTPNEHGINYIPNYSENVLNNILSNAIHQRFLFRRIITFKWLVEIERQTFHISGNGTGIDLAKNTGQICGMYKTFGTNPESKGIGLFITKSQIDAVDGSIAVESTPKTGTTFKISIL
jgi:K+-sensing histidine kinase KdpD